MLPEIWRPTQVNKIVSALRKEREIALYENVRIHLDRVEGLGTFIELEAVFDGDPDQEPEQQRKVDFLCDALGVRAEDLIAISYEGMLEAAQGDGRLRNMT